MKTIRLSIEGRDASNSYKLDQPVLDAVCEGKAFRLVINLDDNQFYLVSGRGKKGDKEIARFDYKGYPPTQKALSKARAEVRAALRQYDKDNNICLSTVTSDYGKKGVIATAFVREVDNPCYKSASPMRLYNREVIEYQLAKQSV